MNQAEYNQILNHDRINLALPFHHISPKKINLHWKFLLAILTCFYVGIAEAAPVSENIDAATFSTVSTFTLNDSKLVTKNAFVVLTDEFFSGQTKALKILFTSEKITDKARTDLLSDNETILRNKDHAYLVLFIDKNNQIWQVNYTIVLPGKTVAQTIAWQPEDLKKFSSDYAFNGSRLKLKNKGEYLDQTKKDADKLSWDVDIDLPVFVRTQQEKK